MLSYPVTSTLHWEPCGAQWPAELLSPGLPPPPPFSELQETAAKMLGVERTLFVPTNTMANLISGECLPAP